MSDGSGGSGDDDDVRDDDGVHVAGPQEAQSQRSAHGPALARVVLKATGPVLWLWLSPSCCDCAGEGVGDPTGLAAGSAGVDGTHPDPLCHACPAWRDSSRGIC